MVRTWYCSLGIEVIQSPADYNALMARSIRTHAKCPKTYSSAEDKIPPLIYSGDLQTTFAILLLGRMNGDCYGPAPRTLLCFYFHRPGAAHCPGAIHVIENVMHLA